MNFDITTEEHINQALLEIKQKLIDASLVADVWSQEVAKRVHIDLTFYDNVCNSCKKQLELGKEYKYCGYTRCLECKLSDEEFDDEMS